MSTVMAIGDTQIPYQHIDSIKFLTAVYKKYKPNQVVQIGDLFDQYFANAWGKSADAASAMEEFEEGLDWLHNDFLPIFGKTPVTVIIGNHDERIFKRADEAGIPSKFMKTMKDIYELPKEIELCYNKVIDNVTYVHGHTTKCTAANATEVLTHEYETSIVYGHFHSRANITYLANRRRLVWGFNLGCLIDRHAYAFSYGANYKDKPILGCGLVMNGLPLYIPMILNDKHRWVGKL